MIVLFRPGSEDRSNVINSRVNQVPQPSLARTAIERSILVNSSKIQRSIESFDQVYKKMINALEFTDVSSSFSMEELKSTTAIPVKHA